MAAILSDPVGDILERSRLEPAGAPLRLAAARDEAGTLQHLEMLGDGGQGHLERLGQFGDGGLATARRARIARRVGSARAAKVLLIRSGAVAVGICI